jgi:hypothetical protein
MACYTHQTAMPAYMPEPLGCQCLKYESVLLPSTLGMKYTLMCGDRLPSLHAKVASTLPPSRTTR